MKKKLSSFFLCLCIPFLLISCKDASDNNDSTKKQPNTTIESNTDIKKPFTEENVTNKKEDKTSSNIPTSEIKERNVRLYYYDSNQDKIIYLDSVVEVKDKAVATAIVNALKKPINENIPPTIAKNINIKSASVNLEKDLITIDFTDNFVKEQNLGSGSESMTLKAIANTFGYNFNVNHVKITLAGKPYSSGHISYNKDEFITVSYDNCFEYK